ncbi:MAG: S1 RNA-binding domain-containing protein, partial [Pseudomonadales bacterium]|nr:S1 RNA-binding domain-containing protein [Pseudomonadales bacterium]
LQSAVVRKAILKQYNKGELDKIGQMNSVTERNADMATRDVMDWLKCEYMQSEVGSEFSGIVTAVTGFGLFVELKDVYIEGLIHITALPKDYYHFEAAKQRMIGERTRKVFRLGDQLNVKVVQVNLDDRKIDFELVSTIASAKKVRGAKKSSKTKAPAKQSVESQELPAAVEQAPERAEDYSSSRKPAQKKPGRSDKLNVDQPPATEHKTKRKPKKVKVKAVGDKVKAHLSSAEREIEQLNKGSKGVSNRAKKRKAKKVLKKSVKKQQS